MEIGKRLFRYLNVTSHPEMHFSSAFGIKADSIVAYADAYWGDA